MKKILTSVFAAAALLFGLASCSGDLHDKELGNPLNLDGYNLVGSMSGWDNTKALPITNVSGVEFKYTVNFTASGSDEAFAFIPALGSWDGQIGGDQIIAGTGSDDGISYEKQDNGFGAFNGVLKGLKSGSYYEMTIDSSSGLIAVSAKEKVAPVLPTPYYLDGYYLVGCAEMGNGFSFGTNWLVWGASLDEATGVVTYTKDFTFNANPCGWHTGDAVIKLATEGWGNSYSDGAATIAVGGEAVKLNYKAEGGDNTPVTGLKNGGAYRATITTTPEKEVSIAIKEICNYTLTFKVVGGTEGTEYYFDGSVFGDWHNKWPIVEWSSNNANAYADAKSANPGCFATADENGVATFTSSVSFVGEPGETATYKIKVVTCTSDGANPAYNPSDISFDIDVSAKTFVVAWDVSEDDITVE